MKPNKQKKQEGKIEEVHPLLYGCNDSWINIYLELGLDWKTIKKCEEYHNRVIDEIDQRLKQRKQEKKEK